MFCSLFKSFAHYWTFLKKTGRLDARYFLSFNIVECAPARRVTNSDGEKQFPREFGLNIVLVVYFLK